jgi:hypothetical protein
LDQAVPEGASVEWEVELVDFDKQPHWEQLDAAGRITQATALKDQGNAAFKQARSFAWPCTGKHLDQHALAWCSVTDDALTHFNSEHDALAWCSATDASRQQGPVHLLLNDGAPASTGCNSRARLKRSASYH